MLVETPRIRNSARARRARSHRRGEVAAAAGELDEHRVEVRADLGPDEHRAAVEAHAAAAGRAVDRDPPGVGAEPVGRVLGGDAALEGGPADLDVVLASGRGPRSVSPEAIRSCELTRSTSVISSVTVCSTWIRGFISMKT